MKDDQPPNQTTKKPPTLKGLRANAEALMRSCLEDSGQSIDEAVVQRQAAKIVKSFKPSVEAAWGIKL